MKIDTTLFNFLNKRKRRQTCFLWLGVIFLLIFFYLNYAWNFAEAVKVKGTKCNAYHSALEIYEDNTCFPPFIVDSSFPKIYANASRDVESGTNQFWAAPKDCIDGKEMWEYYRNAKTLVKSFKDVVLWSQSQTIFFKGSTVFSHSHRCGDAQTFWTIFKGLLVTNKWNIEEAVLDSSQRFGDSFYHLMQEKAFMLGNVRSLLAERNTKVIFEGPPLPKLLEFTDLLGIAKSNVVFLEPFVQLNVQTLHVPYLAECAVSSSGNTLLTRKWIRDRFPEFYSIVVPQYDIVIVDRTEGGLCKRCLLNSNELLESLQVRFPTRKVHLMKLGECSMFQVMKALSSTSLLIAPHGAGLANMIFLPDHANVVEVINHPGQCNMCFYELSLVLGLGYRGTMPLATSPNTVNSDLMDIEKVMLAIEKLEGRMD